MKQANTTRSTTRTTLDETPREVLARIVPGDPLEVRGTVANRVRERALFLDLDRVIARTYALIAQALTRVARAPSPAFVTQLANRALDQLIEEEATDVLEGEGSAPRAFCEFARPLGLDPEVLRLACARYHALDENVRRAFFHLVVEGRPVETLPTDHPHERKILLADARRAFDALRRSVPPDSPPSHTASS